MIWLLLNVPLMVLFFALWVGVPMWLVLKRPDTGPARPRRPPSRACPCGGMRTVITAVSPSPAWAGGSGPDGQRSSAVRPRQAPAVLSGPTRSGATAPEPVRGCRDAGLGRRVHGGCRGLGLPGCRARRILADQPVAPLSRLRVPARRAAVAGGGSGHPGQERGGDAPAVCRRCSARTTRAR